MSRTPGSASSSGTYNGGTYNGGTYNGGTYRYDSAYLRNMNLRQTQSGRVVSPRGGEYVEVAPDNWVPVGNSASAASAASASARSSASASARSAASASARSSAAKQGARSSARKVKSAPNPRSSPKAVPTRAKSAPARVSGIVKAPSINDLAARLAGGNLGSSRVSGTKNPLTKNPLTKNPTFIDVVPSSVAAMAAQNRAQPPVPPMCENVPAGGLDQCYRAEMDKIAQAVQSRKLAINPCAERMVNVHQAVVLSYAQSIMSLGYAATGGRRGILCWHSTGSGKCFVRGTRVMLADGSDKAVEDVVPGDEVMGDDGQPRRVDALGRGTETLYDIVDVGTGDVVFGCNASHILVSLDANGDLVQMTVAELVAKHGARPHGLVGYKLPGVRDGDLAVHTFPFRCVRRPAGEYYGFTISGNNRRFVLADGTVVHNTVTCLGLAIAALRAQRYRNAKGDPVKFDIRLLTTPENRRNNTSAVYAENAATYPEFRKELEPGGVLANLGPPTPEEIAKRAFKDYGAAHESQISRLMTPQNFSMSSDPWIASALSDANKIVVLIMDEVQNLITPSSKMMQYARNMEKIRKFALEHPNKCYVFGLTATPSSAGIPEFIDLLNLHRPLAAPGFSKLVPAFAREPYAAVKQDLLGGRYDGVVSFVEARGDKTMYGQLSGSGMEEDRVKNVRVQMTPVYYAAFLKAISGASKLNSDVQFQPDKPDDFFKNARLKSTLLNKTDAASIIGDSMPVVQYGTRVWYVSPKLAEMIKYIKSHPDGKHFVYCGTTEVANMVEAALWKQGYSRVGDDVQGSEERANDDYEGTKAPKKGEKADPAQQKADAWYRGRKPGKHYIRYMTGVTKNPNGSDGKKIGDPELRTLKAIFQDPRNLLGDMCQIILTEGRNYEGLDIPGLTSVLAVWPLPTRGQDRQWWGRALRTCGHSNPKLPKERRVVDVIRFMSSAPRDPRTGKPMKVREIVDSLGLKIKNVDALEAAETRIVEHNGRSDEQCCGNESDANSIVWQCSRSRRTAVELEDFQECLKARAVDCQAFKQPYHAGYPISCGKCTMSGGNGASCQLLPKPQADANYSYSARSGRSTSSGRTSSGSSVSGSKRGGGLAAWFGIGSSFRAESAPRPAPTKLLDIMPSGRIDAPHARVETRIDAVHYKQRSLPVYNTPIRIRTESTVAVKSSNSTKPTAVKPAAPQKPAPRPNRPAGLAGAALPKRPPKPTKVERAQLHQARATRQALGMPTTKNRIDRSAENRAKREAEAARAWVEAQGPLKRGLFRK